jgi:hypothetical protein
MNDPHRTPNKEDKKQAAQPVNEDSSALPEPDRKRPSKQEHEADNMKKPKTTQRTGRKHAMEIVAMKGEAWTHKIF